MTSAELARAAETAPRFRTNGNNRAISIHGAREHNLKNIDVEIPRDQMVVITGLSGSGKSTLAFDILVCGRTTTFSRQHVALRAAIRRAA